MPPDPTDAWDRLCAQFADHPEIEPGTMMRRPALCHRGKTLVFLARLNGPGMGARIGDASPEALGLTDWHPLQPFRDKAPMRGWIVSRPPDAALWPEVTMAALAAAKEATT